MNCPNCNTTMQIVKTTSSYGAQILLDQCPKCSGIWLDKHELYQVKESEVSKINNINVNKLAENKIIQNKKLACPKDHNELEIFKDANFPKSLLVEYCKICHGFWFNRGELTEYEKYRKEKLKISQINIEENKEFNESINKLLASYSNKNNYNALTQLGEALNTPYYNNTASGGNPFITPLHSSANIGFDIIRIILQSFLAKK